MDFYYTKERNVQILLSLLKENGIKKIIASPGATNVAFVASIQHDSFFEIYSCVDERSAAYMACGLSLESGEVVVLSCTGATSSRNYMPGLTEAYYSKLPILTITSSMDTSKVGHLFAQATDRSTPPSDVVRASFELQYVSDTEDEWDCIIKANKAISELQRRGGGPVHLNLITRYNSDYSCKELPVIRSIKRIEYGGAFPELPSKQKIVLFIGSHQVMTQKQSQLIDYFCAKYDALVFCDHTSGYYGDYRILSSLICAQESSNQSDLFNFDLMIHLGDISGDYYTQNALVVNDVWRISQDGEIRDRFKALSYIFEMRIDDFFEHYIDDTVYSNDSNYNKYNKYLLSLRKLIPELPFSNIWIAQKLSMLLPEKSALHLGILNTLRSWNFFEVPSMVYTHSNVGGFGIDGLLSTLVGASLANANKLYFGILGDLAYFYDMNVTGNRHLRGNVRIMVINNGRGYEFRSYKHSASIFGDDTDNYIAAAGHFGNMSPVLLKNFAENLGFEYLTASSKNDFTDACIRFTSLETTGKPIIFEVFTNYNDEFNSLKIMRNLDSDALITAKRKLKDVVKKIF